MATRRRSAPSRMKRTFIPLDRGLVESDLYRGWSPIQRSVAIEFYALMRITPGTSRHGYVLGPGELDHSLRFIARRVPKCTKDVVEGVVNALRRGGFLTTRKPTGTPTRAVVRKLTVFADLADSGMDAADSIDDRPEDDPPTDGRQTADNLPTQETEVDREGDADQGGTEEELFRRLFAGCPRWLPLKRALTSSAYAALEAEALLLCRRLLDLPANGGWHDAARREALDLLDRHDPKPDRRITP